MKRLAVSALALAIFFAIAGCSSGQTDLFQTDKTTSIEVSDVVFEMPGYYIEAKSGAPEGYTAWYAGSENDPTAMLITGSLKGSFDSETAFEEDAHKTIDGLRNGFSVRDEDVDTDQAVDIAAQPGRIVTAEGQYGGHEQRFRAVVFFNTATNETGLLVLFVKKGEKHDFEGDFTKALESASLSENAKSLIAQREEEQAEAERAAQKEEEERKAKEEAERKAEEEKQRSDGIARNTEEEEKRKAEEEAAKLEEQRKALEESFPVDTAYKAATVALTNSLADDVFTEDGSAHDSSLYHSYSDTSGFYLELIDKGEWSFKDENTWHVEGFRYHIPGTSTEVWGSLDVYFDGQNYIVSDITGMEAMSGKEDMGTKLETIEE